eukprot:SAG31_NODE_42817_length_270_cov_0.555556_1_plen_42_part_01
MRYRQITGELIVADPHSAVTCQPSVCMTLSLHGRLHYLRYLT